MAQSDVDELPEADQRRHGREQQVCRYAGDGHRPGAVGAESEHEAGGQDGGQQVDNEDKPDHRRGHLPSPRAEPGCYASPPRGRLLRSRPRCAHRVPPSPVRLCLDDRSRPAYHLHEPSRLGGMTSPKSAVTQGIVRLGTGGQPTGFTEPAERSGGSAGRRLGGGWFVHVARVRDSIQTGGGTVVHRVRGPAVQSSLQSSLQSTGFCRAVGTTPWVKRGLATSSPTRLHHFSPVGARNATTAWVKLSR